MARGYLNRPELTAARFIPDPFSFDPQARLYKTGDVARYLPDGAIEFLGRMDHQVKIRGFRIELGEIEAVLAHHPQVNTCVVVAREDQPGDNRLVAYVVPENPATFDTLAVRQLLKQYLPEYMVPVAFVVMPELPLSSNQKIDRYKLPKPELDRDTIGTAFVPPQTPVEQELAQIWARILDVEQIGLHDNFFDLGGHSLKATQVLARVRDSFQIELPLRSMFEAATLAQLALVITQTLAEQEDGEELLQMIEELKGLSEEDLAILLKES